MRTSTTPVEAAFELQRQTIRQSQKLVEQGLDFQRDAVEAALQNTLAIQRGAQRQATELSRNVLAAQLDAVALALDVDRARATIDRQFRGSTERTRKLLNRQFDDLERARNDAWDAYEAEVRKTVGYLSEQQKRLIADSTEQVLDVQRETARQTIDGARRAQEPARAARRQAGETARSSRQRTAAADETPRETAADAVRDAEGSRPERDVAEEPEQRDEPERGVEKPEHDVADEPERRDEPEPPIDEAELEEFEAELEELEFPATGTEIVAAAGDREVEADDESYAIEELVPHTDEETFDSPTAARARVQRPTVAAAMKRIAEANETLQNPEFPRSQSEAYEKTLRELRAIDPDDDDEGIRAIGDWIVEQIRDKDHLPGSRAVRRQAAKYCRANGYAVRSDEWLGI